MLDKSLVAHSGNLAEEYLVWFVYYYTTIKIIAAFKSQFETLRRSNT